MLLWVQPSPVSTGIAGGWCARAGHRASTWPAVSRSPGATCQQQQHPSAMFHSMYLDPHSTATPIHRNACHSCIRYSTAAFLGHFLLHHGHVLPWDLFAPQQPMLLQAGRFTPPLMGSTPPTAVGQPGLSSCQKQLHMDAHAPLHVQPCAGAASGPVASELHAVQFLSNMPICKYDSIRDCRAPVPAMHPA